MKSSASTQPLVSVVTAHGRQALNSVGDERLFDLLDRHHVPWSAVSIYVVPRDGGPASRHACLDKRLSELTNVSDVVLYFNRKVNPFNFTVANFSVLENSDEKSVSTKYLY